MQLVQSFVDKAYRKRWGTRVYMSDDLFDNGNPWDDPPSLWMPPLETITPPPRPPRPLDHPL